MPNLEVRDATDADLPGIMRVLAESGIDGGKSFSTAEAREHLPGARAKLTEAQGLFAESAREWGSVAAALDTSARTGEAAPLHEAAARCRRIADIEVAAMRQLAHI